MCFPPQIQILWFYQEKYSFSYITKQTEPAFVPSELMSNITQDATRGHRGPSFSSALIHTKDRVVLALISPLLRLRLKTFRNGCRGVWNFFFVHLLAATGVILGQGLSGASLSFVSFHPATFSEQRGRKAANVTSRRTGVFVMLSSRSRSKLRRVEWRKAVQRHCELPILLQTQHESFFLHYITEGSILQT